MHHIQSAIITFHFSSDDLQSKQIEVPVKNADAYRRKPAPVKPLKRNLKTTKHHQFINPALISTFKGHTDRITSGAVSANGKGLVTAGLGKNQIYVLPN